MSVESVIRARLHRPDVCLPASGLREIASHGVARYDARNLKLPFRSYTYQSGETKLFVFFCQWESGSKNQLGLAASKGLDRFRSVLKGRRRLGQQTLEVIITGCETRDAAETAFRRKLETIIAPDPGSRKGAGAEEIPKITMIGGESFKRG